jgi:hypothetical protein
LKMRKIHSKFIISFKKIEAIQRALASRRKFRPHHEESIDSSYHISYLLETFLPYESLRFS